jgi:hypothetical protein
MGIDTERIRAIAGEGSIDRVWQHTEWLSREVPERISGWPEAQHAADYLTDQLRTYGFEAHQDALPGLVSYPRRGSLDVITPERQHLEAMTFAHSTSTPANGLEGGLVYTGAGGETDYEDKDVRGKIVLAELSYAPPRPEKTRIASERGAIGLVLINWGDDDNPSIPMGTVKPVWGNPTVDNLHQMPNLPAIGVARADGVRVRDLILGGATVRARIVADADREWRTLRQPHAALGAGSTPHWVLIADHLDSWGGGATDNATGNAVTLEVARVLAGHHDELRRDVRVAFWQAHENGIMEGSTWFVDHYWDDIKSGLSGYINIDSPGMKYAREYEASLSPELWSFHREVMPAALGYLTEPKRLPKTGDQSFFGAGVPAITGRSSFPEHLLRRWHGAVLAPWYQSTDDTMEVVDRDVLAQDLKITLAYAWELATRAVLPYDFRDPARILRETIEGYRSVAGETLRLEDVVQRATEFERAATELRGQTGTLEEQLSHDPESSELRAMASDLNEGMREITQAITPVLSSVVGRYGQDSYGLSALRQWVPSLASAPALAGKDPLNGDHALWWGKLVRERNRVADALDTALRLARDLNETRQR